MAQVEKYCTTCKNVFFVYKYRAKIAKFCSKKCAFPPNIRKTCIICSKEFFVSTWRKKQEHCSKICAYKNPERSRKIVLHTPNHKGVCYNTGRTHFKKGFIPANKGMKGYRHSGSFKKGHKGVNVRSGESHYLWKGEEANYYCKHRWLRHWYGNPLVCEHCSKNGSRLTRKDGVTYWNIHWAKLKDKKYERKRENFIGLCASCHRKYDTI